MNEDMKPPWKIHSFGWVSMGWKNGTAQTERNNFEEWFSGLPENEKSSFISKFPESPWWPNYYRFVEIQKELSQRDKLPSEFIEIMQSIKSNQEAYANEVYCKALKAEDQCDFCKAEELYGCILQNYGNYQDSLERCEKLRKNNV